jgi:hypothetical protein
MIHSCHRCKTQLKLSNTASDMLSKLTWQPNYGLVKNDMDIRLVKFDIIFDLVKISKFYFFQAHYANNWATIFSPIFFLHFKAKLKPKHSSRQT